MSLENLSSLNIRTFTGSAFQPSRPAETPVALTMTGQMIRGLQHCRIAPELLQRLIDAGYSPEKIHLLATSSGALSAICAGVTQTTEDSTARHQSTSSHADHVLGLWVQFTGEGGMKALIKHLLGNFMRVPAWAARSLANICTRKPVPPFPALTPFRRAINNIMDSVENKWSNKAEKTGFDVVVDHPTRMTLVLTEARFSQQWRPIIRHAVSAIGHGLHYFVTTEPATVAQKVSSHVDAALNAAHDCFQPVYAVKPSHGAGDIGSSVRESLPIRDGRELRAAVEATICIPFFYTFGFQGLPFGGRGFFDGVWSEGAPIEEALKQGAKEVFVFNDGVHKNGEFSGNVRQREVLAQFVSNSKVPSLARGIERFLKALRLDRVPYFRRGAHMVSGFRAVVERATRPEDLQGLLKNYPEARIHVVGLPPDYPARQVDPVVGRFLADDPRVITAAFKSGDSQVQAIEEILKQNRVAV